MADPRVRDAIVIGGGFYGAAISAYLAKHRGMSNVMLVEREPELLARASYNNQARVHTGYHYPRSFTTAYRSRVNVPRFVRDWRDSVKRDFTKIYAIARRNSKVTAKQFQRFCREIGARLEPCTRAQRKLFEPRLIERAFLVEEFAFDAKKLAGWAAEELRESGVETRLGTSVRAIAKGPGGLSVECATASGETTWNARYVFNCTYSGANQFGGDFPGTQTRFKHEIAELALVDVPSELRDVGVTVMDGPFFSVMPFPAAGLHTLSHVRYTPHTHWLDQRGVDPYHTLERYEKDSRVDRMMRDAARYMPAVLGAKHVRSLFEVKTVLLKNEGDDGRPILFERHDRLPNCYTVLGGKIDNIYDVLELLGSEPLTLH